MTQRSIVVSPKDRIGPCDYYSSAHDVITAGVRASLNQYPIHILYELVFIYNSDTGQTL
jgi:hypothetical protein